MIGAAFLDGSYENASNCARFFLTEIKLWLSTSLFDGTWDESRPNCPTYPSHFAELEASIGYKFRDRSLLVEAMTHPSFDMDFSTCSYQRLAFLGDGVLEMVVMDSLCCHEMIPSSSQLQLSKAALINAKHLAFLCMEFSSSIEFSDIEKTETGEILEVRGSRPIHLWRFMKFQNPAIAKGRKESLRRFSKVREKIRSALSVGEKYPWQELVQMQAEGFFSDLVQSLLGAVFLDSRGDLSQCKRLASSLGILQPLDRIVSGELDTLHPKSILNELASEKVVHYNLVEDNHGLTCTVKIGDVEVVGISGGFSKEEITTRAAELAIQQLRGTKFGQYA
jgi:dsRNA-specific ribonuclease